MARLATLTGVALALIACSGTQPAKVKSPAAEASAAPDSMDLESAPHEENSASSEVSKPTIDAEEFKPNDTETRGLDEGVKPSTIKPTGTEAAVKFTVIDKDKGPIPGLVIKLSDHQGAEFYADETDAKGYTELLLPMDKTYEVEFLSLGRKKIAAKLTVPDKPQQTLRMVLRYKKQEFEQTKGLVLEGVVFDTGKSTLRPESYPKLDRVFEYLKHRNSVRIEISGHTDNVGTPRSNKILSQQRAEACRQYLLSKGIDAGRIKAKGYGEERPIASNNTPGGRQANRRIEAKEL